jgi:NADP-dependent 3-hydroxy acid dehydrogenase YdfG
MVMVMVMVMGHGAGARLTMLIKNVGVEFGDPCPLLVKKLSDMDGMIDINVRFSSLMTARCLPLLLASAKGVYMYEGGEQCRQCRAATTRCLFRYQGLQPCFLD